MRVLEYSQRNPAAIAAAALLLLLFGGIALFGLPIQLLPNTSLPHIVVQSGWRESAPAEIERALIEPQEKALAGLSGLTEMRSLATRGAGVITLQFALGTDMTRALVEVTNRLSRVYPAPPEDADPPLVRAGGGDPRQENAATLLLRPAPGNTTQDLGRYQKLVEDVVRPRLAQIPGVANVSLPGNRPQQVQVEFDPQRAAARGISVERIADAISGVEDVSAGFVKSGRRQLTVRFAGREPLATLSNLILGWSAGRPIYLHDVADIKVGLGDATNYTLRNGEPAMYIRLLRGSDSNTVSIIDDVKQAIVELNQGVLKPQKLYLDLSWDASIYIRRAIGFVRESLILGVLLAVGGLWYFLRGMRPLAVIALTIPLSLAFAVVALELLGRSINVISLAGLSFSTGIVTDAVLIMQGNVIRYFQSGRNSTQATLEGAVEVIPALVASVLTSIAIFAPVLFMRGVEGQLFTDLAITMAVAHAASLLVAMTVIPAANRWALAHHIPSDQHQHWWRALARFGIDWTDNRWLRAGWIILLVPGSVLFSAALLPSFDYLPSAPTDTVIAFFPSAPGSNLETTKREVGDQIIARLSPHLTGNAQPEIRYYNLFMDDTGANQLTVYSRDPLEAAATLKVLQDQVLAGFPDIDAYVWRDSLLAVDGGNNRGISMRLQGANIEGLLQAAAVAQQAVAAAIPGANPQPTPPLTLAEPELRLNPDEQRITQAGLDRGSFGSALRALTGGLFVNEYFDGDTQMNVILRGPRWHTPEELAEIPLVTPSAGVQTIGDLAGLVQTVGPTSLLRLNSRRTVELTFEPPANMTIDEAMDLLALQVEPRIRAALPADATLSYSGSVSDLHQALQVMGRNFILAVAILFALMTALFRSVRDSCIVLLVLPVATAGGIAGLRLLGLFHFQAFDLLTMIGVIILLGLVVNAAILLVDQTRAAERAGHTRREAVGMALAMRARPILLSTLTAVLGMLPLMLVPGIGVQIYRGLASVIVGGMILGTIFTWFLMPSLLRLGENANLVQAEALA
jgi:HAE1 family hydrophobic/amphiphilic exporter-1